MSTSSPVADISSIRTLIYKAGNPDDVLSSIDVSVAFLQANPYHEVIPRGMLAINLIVHQRLYTIT